MHNLVVRDLEVERAGRVVLDHCTAEFLSGKRTVLWGSSGAGKSTLLHVIAGLLSPQSGTVQLGERVLFAKKENVDVQAHERDVGFVFQDLALWPHLTAIDQVYLVGHPSGLDRTNAEKLLESVGLRGLTHRRPGELSGGEQQRLAIARALAGKPSILLLDEPFSSLDRRTKESLYDLLRQVSPSVPGPTIYVTHHVDDAVALAEAVITLQNGKLTPAERPWEEQE